MRDVITVKEILTREKVMEVLKIGRSTFYKLIQTGQLKRFKEGKRYKVPVKYNFLLIAHEYLFVFRK